MPRTVLQVIFTCLLCSKSVKCARLYDKQHVALKCASSAGCCTAPVRYSRTVQTRGLIRPPTAPSFHGRLQLYIHHPTALPDHKVPKRFPPFPFSYKLLTMTNAISTNDLYTMSKTDYSTLDKDICELLSTEFLDFIENKNRSHSTSGDISNTIKNMEMWEDDIELLKTAKKSKNRKTFEVESQDITLPFNKTEIPTTNYEPCNQQLLTSAHGCYVCNKSFTCKSKLDQHTRIHTGEKPYACKVCGTAFIQQSHLIRHNRIHTGEKPYACKVCGTAFNQQSHLIRHNRMHTGEKPYACKVCGATFSEKSILIKHSRIHTGEKPFACKVCGSKFSRQQSLTIHNRVHTGEKPYVCKVCGNKFSHLSTLNVHNRIHTGERPYACIVCGSKFSHQSTLKIHNRIHAGEKPFKCAQCDMSFRCSSDRLGHMRSTHNHSF